MPFQEGNKFGGLGGRPKGSISIAGKFRKLFEDGGIEKLKVLLNSENEKTVLESLRIVLERGWGKPKETISVDGDIGLFPVGRMIAQDPEACRLVGEINKRISLERKENEG